MGAATQVNITELRKRLPEVLDRVCAGEEVDVLRRGKVIARITKPMDRRSEARKKLTALRRRARIGDIESPLNLAWEAMHAPA